MNIRKGKLIVGVTEPIINFFDIRPPTIRFILDQTGNIRWAFGDVDRNILILMSHKMCPSLVNKGYILIKSYLEKQISDVQNAATRTSGTTGSSSFMDRMKSNCTIM
jgi:hypothetical protein